jgi:hypothetical protein
MANMKALVPHPSGELKLEEGPVPEFGNNPYAPHDFLARWSTATDAATTSTSGTLTRPA